MRYPTLPITDEKVKRMLGALSLNKGAQAPKIEGLSEPIAQPTIVVFFDSDCDHCRTEIDRLKEQYQEITKKGYRIITISGDMHSGNYQPYAATFPWKKTDQLCDFKGLEGTNFKNYGIVGTPMIFVIDKTGVISGKYAQLHEFEIK
jgi:peroxiredoxin